MKNIELTLNRKIKIIQILIWIYNKANKSNVYAKDMVSNGLCSTLIDYYYNINFDVFEKMIKNKKVLKWELEINWYEFHRLIPELFENAFKYSEFKHRPDFSHHRHHWFKMGDVKIRLKLLNQTLKELKN